MSIHKIVTLKEFCEATKMGRRSFELLRRKGKAPRTLAGRRKVLMLEQDVNAWIESNLTKEAA